MDTSDRNFRARFIEAQNELGKKAPSYSRARGSRINEAARRLALSRVAAKVRRQVEPQALAAE